VSTKHVYINRQEQGFLTTNRGEIYIYTHIIYIYTLYIYICVCVGLSKNGIWANLQFQWWKMMINDWVAQGHQCLDKPLE